MPDQPQPGASNFLNLVGDPSDITELAKAQARIALSQGLLQQGQQGMPPPNQMAGNVVIRNSPLSGLASALSSYAGSRGIMQGAQDGGSIQQNRFQNAMKTFEPNSQDPSQPTTGPKAGQGPFKGMTPAEMLASELSTPGSLAKIQSEYNLQQSKPTDVTLAANQSGAPP